MDTRWHFKIREHFTIYWYNTRNSHHIFPLEANRNNTWMLILNFNWKEIDFCIRCINILLNSRMCMEDCKSFAYHDCKNWYRFSAFWLRSKCSICSYQLNIWYEGHRPSSILNWFLDGDRVSAACCGSIMCWPCIAVPQGTAHFPTKFSLINTMFIKEKFDDSNYQSQLLCDHYVLKKPKLALLSSLVCILTIIYLS